MDQLFMRGSLVKTEAYATLVNDITELCNHARKTLVESYWKIGKRIVEQEQQGDGKELRINKCFIYRSDLRQI